MKLPSLPLFTDTFTAETVHLTNNKIGIYIRLLCFAWTKNSKPFTTESAFRICQCLDDQCCIDVYEVLEEFFNVERECDDRNKKTWTHKRLLKEYDYLQGYYGKRSDAGKKGMAKRWEGVNNKTITPIPNPIPIPNNNNFEIFWDKISNKRGSKKMAKAKYDKECKDQDPEHLAKIFNYFSNKIKDKTFIPHVSTWINQRRFEDEDVQLDPKKAIIPTKLADGREYKTVGSFGNYFEILLDGEKWYKHKFKDDEPLKKDI